MTIQDAIKSGKPFLRTVNLIQLENLLRGAAEQDTHIHHLLYTLKSTSEFDATRTIAGVLMALATANEIY